MEVIISIESPFEALDSLLCIVFAPQDFPKAHSQGHELVENAGVDPTAVTQDESIVARECSDVHHSAIFKTLIHC